MAHTGENHLAILPQHHRLVNREVQRMITKSPKYYHPLKEDLTSCGYMGLIEALRRFDSSKGFHFETFATLRVRGAIFDGLRNMSRFTRSAYQQLKQLADSHSDASLRDTASSQTMDKEETMASSQGVEYSIEELSTLAQEVFVQRFIYPITTPEVEAIDALELATKRNKLSVAFSMLDRTDQALLVAVYDLRRVGDCASKYADRLKVHRSTISRRHHAILGKLQKILSKME